jgi:hypothetical protein
MSRLIEFPLEGPGKATILVEVDDAIPAKGQQRVSVGGVVAEQAGQAFDSALVGIKSVAGAIMAQLNEVAANANEISVEFGIKLTANAGIIVAGTSAEGNCKIAIKWSRKP